MRPCSTHLRAERGGGVQWVDVKAENVLPTKATHARMLYTAIYYAVYIRTYIRMYIHYLKFECLTSPKENVFTS